MRTSTETMTKVDPTDAPEGYVAVAADGECAGCAYECDGLVESACLKAPCTAMRRKDGCDVIFKQKPEPILGHAHQSELERAYSDRTCPDCHERYHDTEQHECSTEGMGRVLDATRADLAAMTARATKAEASDAQHCRDLEACYGVQKRLNEACDAARADLAAATERAKRPAPRTAPNPSDQRAGGSQP
jgi:hypothetical protein